MGPTTVLSGVIPVPTGDSGGALLSSSKVWKQPPSKVAIKLKPKAALIMISRYPEVSLPLAASRSAVLRMHCGGRLFLEWPPCLKGGPRRS